MLGGVAAVYGSFGLIVASTSALVPAIRADLDLSRGQMGLVLGAWQLAYIGASLPAARIIDRIGLRQAILVSISLMVASAILRSAAQGFITLLLAVAVLGVGGPLISIGAPKAAAVLFAGAERSRAVGVYGTAPAIGGAIALATANGIVGDLLDNSWRSVSLVYAAMSALAGVLWMFVSGSIDDVAPDDEAHLSVRDLIALPIVRVVLVMAVLGFTVSHGIGQWMVDLLADGGRPVSTAGYLAALGMVITMVGSLVLPVLATAARRVAILAGALAVGSVGVAALTVGGPGVFATIAASSIGRVAVMPICMLFLMDHRDVGPRNIAVAGGLFFSAAQFGGVGGPYLTGLLADASGSFDLPVAVHASLLIALALYVVAAVPRAVRS